MKIRVNRGLLFKKIISLRAIYSFYGYIDLGYFFSVYDSDKPSLVVVPDYLAQSPVLIDAVGEKNILSLEQPPELGHPEPSRQNRLSHFATLIWAAVKLRFLFSFVDRKAEIFLFNDFSVFTTFVLAGIFRRKGLDIKWVETLPWLKTEASPKELVASRGEGFGEYLNILSAIVGERIVEAQHRPREAKISDAGAPCQVTAVGYALAEPLPEKKIALLSWPEIKQKFGLQDFSPREKAVLMIETPLYYTFPKVDMRGTYTRVAAYLNTVLEPGVKIHFKLHYSNPGNNHFAGTIVEDRLKLLPHSVPAELYVMGYDRVYFFMSSSVLSPTRARLFSLSQLIEFEDEKERKRYFATYDVIFGGHPQHIEMITDKSVEA